MNKRGVSPVIATVLLIGIVIALGLVVFLWFRGFTQEAITKFSGQNVQIVCTNVQFDASYSSGIISISNTGTVPIYDFDLQVTSAGGSYQTLDISQIISGWPKQGLNQGDVFSGDISSYTGSATQVILIPVLRGSTTSGTQQSYACSNNGYKISLS